MLKMVQKSLVSINLPELAYSKTELPKNVPRHDLVNFLEVWKELKNENFAIIYPNEEMLKDFFKLYSKVVKE